jgi:hypothetical protein
VERPFLVAFPTVCSLLELSELLETELLEDDPSGVAVLAVELLLEEVAEPFLVFCPEVP